MTYAVHLRGLSGAVFLVEIEADSPARAAELATAGHPWTVVKVEPST